MPDSAIILHEKKLTWKKFFTDWNNKESDHSSIVDDDIKASVLFRGAGKTVRYTAQWIT